MPSVDIKTGILIRINNQYAISVVLKTVVLKKKRQWYSWLEIHSSNIWTPGLSLKIFNLISLHPCYIYLQTDVSLSVPDLLLMFFHFYCYVHSCFFFFSRRNILYKSTKQIKCP